MSFESGTTSLMICPLRNPLPENFLALLDSFSAGRLDDVKEDPVIGWVSGRHLLECEINESTSICGGHLHVNLRKAERKIPAQLLNAICRKEELAWMQANNQVYVPRKERKRIKEDAIERNLMKMPPVISATACVVDRAENVLYLASGSLSQFDAFVMEFTRAMGADCEPVPVSPEELMIKLFKKSETDLPVLSFCGKAGLHDDPATGRDFLTWLWFYMETQSGTYTHPKYGTFTMGFEGPLTFTYSPEKAKDPELGGAGESTVKKGNPMSSAEASAALASGKKLRKAKILLARDDSSVWSFTFDADTFTFGSLSLPEGEESELDARFEERILALHILHEVMEGYFRMFAGDLLDDGKKVQSDIDKWMADREKR